MGKRLSFIESTYVAILMSSLSLSGVGLSQCLSLVKGAVAYDVATCKVVNPAQDFAKDADLSFYSGMTPQDKARFGQTYSGLLLTGKIVYSKARRTGLSDETGVLNGDNLKIYVRPGHALSCNAIQSKRVAGIIDETCCSGSADAPCLLDTSYVLQEVKVIGVPKSSAGDTKRQVAEKSINYKNAIIAFDRKDYAGAAKAFELAKKKQELDPMGYYYLGLTYRYLDLCSKAIAPLRYLADLGEKNEVWGDQKDVLRRSNFLLARCYSKLNRPGEATLILNSYLIEPEKYQPEIQESLKHKDFGWINSAKEFVEYEAKARKAMARYKK